VTATIVMVVVVVALAFVAIALLARAPGRGTATVLPPAVPLTATDALNAFSGAPAAPQPPTREPAPLARREEPSARFVATPLEWTKLVTDDESALDADARIRLVADLGIVRAPWCVPILIRAYDEERDPAVRRAALEALSGFRNSPEARAALERAAASGTAASNGAHAG
jgi:hypothetical protein